mmetsp:Transcript_99281/g.190623  ORF Transcript_99281/g.190623 Transcript_99281/m.190623 type:complete len:214 (+) Transcript_99281:1125-1766(+)
MMTLRQTSEIAKFIRAAAALALPSAESATNKVTNGRTAPAANISEHASSVIAIASSAPAARIASLIPSSNSPTSFGTDLGGGGAPIIFLLSPLSGFAVDCGAKSSIFSSPAFLPRSVSCTIPLKLFGLMHSKASPIGSSSPVGSQSKTLNTIWSPTSMPTISFVCCQLGSSVFLIIRVLKLRCGLPGTSTTQYGSDRPFKSAGRRPVPPTTFT